MINPIRSRFSALLVLVCVGVLGGSVWASPTGLNNIPTTDVVPKNVLVLQTWRNMADDTHTQSYVGMKFGPFRNAEIGIDWKADDRSHGHAEFQGKYSFDVYKEYWRGVVGIANVTDNRKHNGEVFPYVATSLDVKFARLHLGYAPQPHNEAFFAGIDKTIPVLNRNLTLRADAIHMNDKNDALLSAGFVYEFGRIDADENPASGLAGAIEAITKNIILEVWVSKPTTTDSESYTAKLNYVIRF